MRDSNCQIVDLRNYISFQRQKSHTVELGSGFVLADEHHLIDTMCVLPLNIQTRMFSSDDRSVSQCFFFLQIEMIRIVDCTLKN